MDITDFSNGDVCTCPSCKGSYIFENGSLVAPSATPPIAENIAESPPKKKWSAPRVGLLAWMVTAVGILWIAISRGKIEFRSTLDSSTMAIILIGAALLGLFLWMGSVYVSYSSQKQKRSYRKIKK